MSIEITVTVNGVERSAAVEPRRTLADFLREDLELTGTHLGCEHGVCGACTVTVNGASARSYGGGSGNVSIELPAHSVRKPPGWTMTARMFHAGTISFERASVKPSSAVRESQCGGK